MTAPPRRVLARLATAALALALALAAPGPTRARADDEEDAEDAPRVEQNLANFHLDDSYLDQITFGRPVNDGGRSWFAGRLALRLDEVDRACAPTEAQKEKLRLAARGDVKRFQNVYEETRKAFQLAKDDQNKFMEFQQVAILPIRKLVAGGLFGTGSFFGKSLKSTLTADQYPRLAGAELDRRRFRYRARLELLARMMEDSLGLTDEQHRRLVDVLAAETKPPERPHQYDFYLALYRAGRVPEEKLRPIFDDAQWRVVSQQLAMAKGYEQFLKQQGLLDEAEEPGPEGPKDAK